MSENTYILKKNIFENINDFSPSQTFDCGQCFRWTEEKDGSYSGVVSGCFANIAYDDESSTITIWSNYMPESEALRERFWRNYLDLDRDYGAIKEQLAKDDPVMQRAIEQGSGIRILNQEPWETLISFLISQNSNIPRISKSIELLCQEFGEKIGRFEGRILCAFPTIEKLSSLLESELAPCRLGYRARYIAETSRKVAIDGGALLAAGQGIDSKKVEEYLLSLSGVGPKVAHCIMLFSMKKAEIFPIDVWMRRVMNTLYDIDEFDIDEMHAYAKKHFGEYGGIAQQYLFNYIRAENLEISSDPYDKDPNGEPPAYLKYLEKDEES